MTQVGFLLWHFKYLPKVNQSQFIYQLHNISDIGLISLYRLFAYYVTP